MMINAKSRMAKQMTDLWTTAGVEPQYQALVKAYDGATTLEIYYTHTEIENADIQRLFNCASSTATRLKMKAKELMANLTIRTWDASKVNTATAYEAWGIDIEEVEKRLTKLNKLKKAGIIKETTNEPNEKA